MNDIRGSAVVRRAKVLFVSHHLPWPATSGGRRREAELLRVLSGRHHIEVVAITKVPHTDRLGLRQAAELGLPVALFPAAPRRRPLDSSLVWRHRSVEATRYLSRRLAADDDTIVHVEGHYLLSAVPRRAWSRTLLVEHNIESSLLGQRARLAGHLPLATWFDELVTARTERSAWRGVRLLGALSTDDATAMSLHAPGTRIEVLPSGADHLDPVGSASSPTVPPVEMLFVSNFSYPPNHHAARLLVTEILPAVARRVPAVRLAITGAGPPLWLTTVARRDARVVVPGWVDDLSGWLAAGRVFVCPLWIGGGIKVKMLEAVAAGQCCQRTRENPGRRTVGSGPADMNAPGRWSRDLQNTPNARQ